MSIRAWRQDSFRPWVESVAVHIGDPVARLRFLRVAAPEVPTVPNPYRSRLRWRVLVSFLLSFLAVSVVLAFLLLMYAAARARFVDMPSAPKVEGSAQRAR